MNNLAHHTTESTQATLIKKENLKTNSSLKETKWVDLGFETPLAMIRLSHNQEPPERHRSTQTSKYQVWPDPRESSTFSFDLDKEKSNLLMKVAANLPFLTPRRPRKSKVAVSTDKIDLTSAERSKPITSIKKPSLTLINKIKGQNLAEAFSFKRRSMLRQSTKVSMSNTLRSDSAIWEHNQTVDQLESCLVVHKH